MIIKNSKRESIGKDFKLYESMNGVLRPIDNGHIGHTYILTYAKWKKHTCATTYDKHDN